MAKYKKCELELSPHLLNKLFYFIKDPKVTEADFGWIIENIKYLGRCDELLTLDEYDLIVQKPTV